MHITGHAPTTRTTKTVQLPRPDGSGPQLTLSPLPLGFQRRLHDHRITAPQPPSRVARDPQGRPLRQPNGQAVLLSDEHDADYLQERELYYQRVAVLSLVTSLEVDPHVRFDAQASEYADDWRPYADRLHAELEAAHWTAGDLIWLCTEVARLSNLLDMHLTETCADFSTAATATTG